MRQVDRIYSKKPQHWVGDGFHVQSLFSHMDGSITTDPFLLLDYAAPKKFEPNQGSPRGVGQHPHKGFETVTIAYRGEIAHRDSSGGGGVIKSGDVQWMTAGSGIIHEEFHSPVFSEKGGEFEMVQLWVNLPQKDKLTAPSYQHLASQDIPVTKIAGMDGRVAGDMRLIAGEYVVDGETVNGAAKTFTPINLWDINLDAGKTALIDVPESHTLLVLVMNGDVRINDHDEAGQGNLISFTDTGDQIKLTTYDEPATLLLLSGEPINEPIAGYGPFVMNTQAEIRQAITDFNLGKFGQIAN